MALQERGIYTGRSMRKASFERDGIVRSSKCAIGNAQDLIQIVKWNHEFKINVYRISSTLIPWMSEFEISDLPNFDDLKNLYSNIGTLSTTLKQRLSFHPGQFCVLGSPNTDLVKKTIKELNQHAEIMDLMGLKQNFYYPINIHVGGTYGNKSETLKRFSDNWMELSDSCKKRLIVENDDKASMYSVKDLYEGLFEPIGIPITFDYHHHRFCNGGLSEEEALKLAANTWPSGVTQLTHYSSSKKHNEDSSVKEQAHADYVYESINDHGLSFDCEIEAKCKEKAVLKYRNDFKKDKI
jgi:UV DNA damage endonuclease